MRQGDGLWRLTGARSRVTCAGSTRPSLFLGGSSRTWLVACRRRRSTMLLGGVEIDRTLAPGRRRGSMWCARVPGVSVTFRRVASAPPRPAVLPPAHQHPPEPEELVRGCRASNGRVVLVTCVRARCRAGRREGSLSSARFRKARAYAERTGNPWFILSAEHGLVGPDEWLAPYERYLPDTPRPYRTAWGEWVVVRLDLLVGGLAGTVVELHAGESYAQPIVATTRAARGCGRAPFAGAR